MLRIISQSRTRTERDYRSFRFARDENGAVTVDWVVLVSAVVGLGSAVLLSISSGALDIADRTAIAIAGEETAGPTLNDDGTDFYPWVAASETDDKGNTWYYNSNNQLINYEDGSVMALLFSLDSAGGSSIINARGEETDGTGVVLNR
ncbi:MAG: hypothetical protein ACPGRD_00370 [Planktomarina sp.]